MNKMTIYAEILRQLRDIPYKESEKVEESLEMEEDEEDED